MTYKTFSPYNQQANCLSISRTKPAIRLALGLFGKPSVQLLDRSSGSRQACTQDVLDGQI